jgi:hypothetical protein
MIVWNRCIKRSYSCYRTVFDLHIYCFQNINRFFFIKILKLIKVILSTNWSLSKDHNKKIEVNFVKKLKLT